MKLISHCLTPGEQLVGIRSLIRFGRSRNPLAYSVLYPQQSILSEASPKAISRRTSYLRFRLEFLRYSQVITDYFNRRVFGPPQGLTPASTCSWIGHPVSGLLHATFRAVNTRFPFGCGTEYLNLAAYNNSPDRSTKSTSSHINVL